MRYIMSLIQSMDWSILYWIQQHITCGFLDVIMPRISALGNMGMIWIAVAIVMIISKKYRREGVLLLAALLVGVLVGNVILKHVIARPRPCWIDTGIRLLMTSPTDYSFPSGHTLSSVIGATVLTMTNKKFAVAAIPLACLIAFSRLYLFVHFPSDVLAAAVLGLAIGILVMSAAGKFERDHGTIFGNKSRS